MKNLDFVLIGKKLKETRIKKKLTQDYVANIVGVNVSHISNIENNRVKVSLSTLVGICNALDITVDYILSDEYNSPLSSIELEILHELEFCSLESKMQILKIIQTFH